MPKNVQLSEKLTQPVLTFYQEHQRRIEILSFILGFAFDAMTLRRIDERKTILLQTTYLIVVGAVLMVQTIELARKLNPPLLLRKVWPYRESVLNFMLGTLLNSYTIFYFKSASAFTTLLFIGALVAILILNEFKNFGESRVQVHMAFFSLCMISYFVSHTPTLLGFIGSVPFVIATLISLGIFCGLVHLLKPVLASKPKVLRTHVITPYAIVQTSFVLLYFANAIPPVPLSVSYMGIYHSVESKDGGYQLTYTRPRAKFWQHGDQTFLARKGDSIYCYAQIFSPLHFKDQIRVRWLYWNEQLGWQSSDAIPMDIVGGRDEGYRGVTKKEHYQPGLWRVQIETLNRQEVGRISFTVEADESTGPRELTTEMK